MIILPAIDIKDGQCVRLYQGDYAQVTTYDADPVRVALRWQAAGASWLHVVDLDGAAAGHPVNFALIEGMRAATSLRIELGGGMRELAHIEQVLRLGIDRVVLGTAVLSNRALLREALERWGERIAVGLDARAGRVAIAGWQETSHVQATTLARELVAEDTCPQRFIFTDIARDGALQGPNLLALQEMQQAIATSPSEGRGDACHRPASALIASGGIRSLADLRALAMLGLEGAIVGKALYTGDVELAAAIQEIEG